MGSCARKQVVVEPISQPLSIHIKAKPKIFQSHPTNNQAHPSNYSLKNNRIVKQ